MAPKQKTVKTVKTVNLPEYILSSDAYTTFQNGRKDLSGLFNMFNILELPEYDPNLAWQIVESFDRDISHDVKTIVKDVFGKKLPESLKKIKYYSGKESSKRDELSKLALKNYTQTTYAFAAIAPILKNFITNGDITEKDYKELFKSRDYELLLFNVLDGNLAPKKMLEKTKYFLAKDLDPSKFTADELNDIKLHRQSEAINETLREMSKFDVSQYSKLTDEELVKKWDKYERYSKLVSIIKKDFFPDNKKFGPTIPDKYLDKKLLNHFLGLEKKFPSVYTLNVMRMCTIANPYYAQVDPNFLLKLDDKTLNDFAADADKYNDEYFNSFMRQILGYNESFILATFENIAEDFNKYAVVEKIEDLVAFNASGAEVAIQDVKNTSPFFVAPKGHPELLKAFDLNFSVPNAKEIDVANDKKYSKYKSVMNQIKGNMRNIDAESREFLKKYHDAVGNPYVLEGGESIITSITSIYPKVVLGSGKNGIKMDKKYLSECLKMTVANPRPKISKQEFENIFKIKVVDRLAENEVEERRKLTELALDKIIDVEEQIYNGDSDTSEFDKYFNGDRRSFKAIMFRRGLENQEKNKQLCRDFYGLDENDQPIGISKEKLNEIQNQLINERLNEFKSLCDEFNGKDFDDKAIIENYDKLSEIRSIVMEWEGFSRTIYKGLSNENLELLNKIKPVSERITAFYGSRMDYICNPYYQFGNEEYIDTKIAEKVANHPQDRALGDLAANHIMRTMSMSSNFTDQIKTLVGIDTDKLDYIYSGNGEPISVEYPNKLANELKKGHEVYLFAKGNNTPTVLKLSDADVYVVETVQMTKERNANARIMRTNIALDRIMAESTSMPNPPRYINKMSAFVMKQYEIGIIADRLEGLEGKERDAVIKDLRTAMCEYLSLALVKKALFQMKDMGSLQEEVTADLVTEEHLKKYADTLGKSGSVDRLLDDMLKAPNSKELFDQLDEKNMIKQLSVKQAEINKAQALKVQEDAKAFSARAKNTIAYSTQSKIYNSSKFWGTSAEELSNTHKNLCKRFSGLSISRRSIQTIALGYLIKQGHKIDDIFSESKDMEKARKDATGLVIGILTNPQTEKAVPWQADDPANIIAESLKAGAKAVMQYADEKLANLKDFSAREMFTKENVLLTSLGNFGQDFFQEIGTLYGVGSKNVMIPDEVSKIRNQIARYPGIIGFCNSNTKDIVTNMMIASDPPTPIEEVGSECIDKCFMEAAFGAIVRYYKDLSPNHDLKPAEVDIETMMLGYSNFKKILTDNETLMNFQGAVSEDSILAQKTLMAALDGTLIESLNFKVNSITSVKDDDPKIDFTFDTEKMINTIKSKDISKLREFDKVIKCKMPAEKQKLTKAIDPNKKLQQINKQMAPNP